MKATPTEEIAQLEPVAGADLSHLDQAVIDWLAQNTDAHVTIELYWADEGVRWRIPSKVPKSWLPNVIDALLRIAGTLQQRVDHQPDIIAVIDADGAQLPVIDLDAGPDGTDRP